VNTHSRGGLSRPFTLGILLLFTFGCTTPTRRAVVARASDAPHVFQSSGAVLTDLRYRAALNDPSIAPAINALRTDADAALAGGPFTIVDKKHPLPGIDRHDYVSLARYFWPDPDKPGGLPYISRDGQSNPEIDEYDAKPLLEMSNHVYTLALAGYLTGQTKYSARAAYLLRVWFLDDATKMNPNLEHAQLVKGANQGRSYGIIESIRLLNVVDAVGMLGQSTAWSRDDQTRIQAWFDQYAIWMKQSKNGKEEASATNNHGCWYDAQLATFLLFLGKDADAKQLIESAKERRIAAQIEPTGEQPRELARTRSFSYSAYNLAALTLLANLGDRVEVDLWHYQTRDGRSIRAALDWMIPFATGAQKWKHQQLGSLEQQSLLVPLRRAEAAFHDGRYEAAVAALKINLRTNRDALLFPATAAQPR
jgi:hypothetical protein